MAKQNKPKFFQPKESEDKFWILLITELIRWLIIATCILLSIWRYAFYTGYTAFISGTDCSYQNDSVNSASFSDNSASFSDNSASFSDNSASFSDNSASVSKYTIKTSHGTKYLTSDCLTQFWLISSGILLGCSLVIYVPLKLFLASTILREARYLYGWRPSILSYLFLCALPCIVLLLVAISSESGQARTNIDTETLTVIQVIVMGLTLTEWMAKIREETLSFDLVNAMSVDFFFAYDVFDFYNLFLTTEEMYNGPLLYVNFTLAYIAMFKYVPQPPTNECCGIYYKRSIVCILVTLFCNDLPFLIMRITIIALYGMEASDFIHPLKNIALIVFSVAQLFILRKNREMIVKHKPPAYHEKRVERNSKVIEEIVIPGSPTATTTLSADDPENSFTLQTPEGYQAAEQHNGVTMRNKKEPFYIKT